MVTVIALLAGLALGLAAWTVLVGLDPVRKRATANLARLPVGPAVPDVAQPAAGAARPDGLRLAQVARRLTPPALYRLLDRQHAYGGRPASWPMDRLLVLKAAWVPAVLVLAPLVAAASPSPVLTALFAVVALVVYFLPELLLNSNGQKRNETIGLELADTLDQMSIAVEAGLGFDSAMSRVAQDGTGPLSEELSRTLQDIRMGLSRRQAFTALTTRTTAPDLRRFVRAVIQADTYGISVADVLRTQAGEMRLKRRQRAEEKAQKVPVKVLMPLMLCILPVLFIVVLGPAVINIIDAFSGM